MNRHSSSASPPTMDSIHVKRETSEQTDCSYFPRDKENSEPMDIGSPTAMLLLDEPMNSQVTENNLPIAQEPVEVHGQDLTQLQYDVDYTMMKSTPSAAASNGRASSTGRLFSTEDQGKMPQSLTHIIANMPSSAFSIDLPDMQSPVGSGLFSPQRLGKKRPLSISPLSSSSINIEMLVRGSPNSLSNFFTQSRGSSAGSFGHLSPSLYCRTPSTANGFNRPAISLSKAVHPVNLDSFIGGNEEKSAPSGRLPTDNSKWDKSFRRTVSMPAEPPETGNLRLVSEQESDSEAGVLTDPSASSDQSSAIAESESDGKGPHKSRRIYYAYPSMEQPHNNQCKWEGCDKQCNTLEELVAHVNTVHIYQDGHKEFICRWAGCVRDNRPFKAQYMLLVHMRRHTGDKPHKCHYEGCEKAYSRLENLKTHLRSHTGEKPYICKYEGCGKAFSNASDCAKHMNRTHSDEKPYACQNPGCTKRYTDPSSRRKHMKTCQVNKKVCDDGLNTDDLLMDPIQLITPTLQTGAGAKKNNKQRKPDRKKKSEEGRSQIQYGSQDAGYVSNESQCTPGMSHPIMVGQTPLSGYNSSGYDTENPGSLQDEAAIPSMMPGLPDQGVFRDDGDIVIKTEAFDVMGRMQEQPMPHPPSNSGCRYKPSPLQTLPEIHPLRGGMTGSYDFQSSNPCPMSMPPDTMSSGYSSFGNSPIRMVGTGEDIRSSDIASSSRSSFSSCGLSSPSSSNGHDYFAKGHHSYLNHRQGLRPPEHILKHRQAQTSVQITDIKQSSSPFYRHSDEMSLRSSHSSHYSGSEFSDERSHLGLPPPPLALPPPLPDLQAVEEFTTSQPLPLAPSMQQQYQAGSQAMMQPNMGDPQYAPTASPMSVNDIHSPSSYGNMYHNGPIQHYDPPPSGLMKQPLPMIYEGRVARSDSPNMVIGNMNLFSNQLHQESLLFEVLNNTTPSASVAPPLSH